MTTCKETVEYVLPKKLYQLRETVFDKLDAFNIPYSDDQKIFINMATSDVESNCVQEGKLFDTDSTTWTGKLVPISVSTSFNLIEGSIF